MSELKTRVEVLSNQCKMYEEIINKMESKINKITEANKVLEQRNAQYRIKEKFGPEDGITTLRKTLHDQEKINSLRERINEITLKYT